METLVIDENFEGLVKNGNNFELKELIFDGHIKIKLPFGLFVEFSIKSGGSIESGEWIKSGGSIESGEWIKSGGSIESGRSIESGKWIKSGGSIESGEWIKSGKWRSEEHTSELQSQR